MQHGQGFVVASCCGQLFTPALLPGLSGFVLLGLAGLRRPAAAGEITASGAGLSLDIGVNGQLGDAAVRGLALRRVLELSGTSVGLRGLEPADLPPAAWCWWGKHCQVNLVLFGS